MIWKYLERTGNQAVQFIVQIILARLLSPSDFGVIALLLVFINFAQVFVQSGFNTALIQAKVADELDFSSVFYLSLGVASVLYVAFYFCAPMIAVFFKMPRLIVTLRVISIILFFGAVNSIQNAVVAREFKFKQLFYSSLGSMAISGTIGGFMAYSGYGVWALVWQQILNQFFLCAIMWVTVKWRPKRLFSFGRVVHLFSFGWKLLVSALLDTGYREAQSLVIGKMFYASDLGFFSRGRMFPQVVIGNIDGSIQTIMLPALSQMQDDPLKIKDMMRKAISMSAFIILPLMAGMIATAEPLVRIVLTDKWLPCVPFMQICCISFIFYPIHTSNLTAINAVGRSDIFLKLEIIKKVIGITVLAVAIIFFRSLIAIAWSAVLSGIASTFINAYPNKKLIGYTYLEQLRDVMPSFLLSIIMGVCVYIVGCIANVSIYILLLLQIICGILTYTTLAILAKIGSMDYLTKLLISSFVKNKYRV
ncbi:lipopolysaccharide biosynthesis protein [Cloacibacillus porcorum]|uniref:lipopolysaccharide biosynthesis protein n=1 Tax=Cloacibacillus porcorum TaxID=1197717 RepID=UPI001E5A377B|nr:lipopolysaccharide biosynthesis protein [Cloacibacillus porcorum]